MDMLLISLSRSWFMSFIFFFFETLRLEATKKQSMRTVYENRVEKKVIFGIYSALKRRLMGFSSFSLLNFGS